MPGPDDPRFGDAVTTPLEGEPRPAPPELSADPSLAPLAARYELLNELGRGGMGVVYRAQDRETGGIVALKVLQPQIAAQPELIERFKAELLLARKVTHKNVCRVHELLRFGETAVISMEYVPGESLRAVLRRYGGVPLRRGLEWTRQVCAALGEAHAQGVVHRDLKPENILIAADGTVKVMDFGIARSLETGATETAGITGTPAYMAPEQATGKAVDHRSDIYSLGLVLYEMFTGQPAFRADTPVALAMMQVHERPRLPREVEPYLHRFLAEAIEKCLEKEPGKRFRTVAELEAALFEEPKPESKAEAAEPLGPEPHLLRWGRLDTALLLAGVAGLFLFARYALFALPQAWAEVSIDKAAAERVAGRLFAAAGWGEGIPLRTRAGEEARLTYTVLRGLKKPAEELPAVAPKYTRLVWIVRLKSKERDLEWDLRVFGDGAPAGIRQATRLPAAALGPADRIKAAAGPTRSSPQELQQLAEKYLKDFYDKDAGALELSEVSDVDDFFGQKTHKRSWLGPADASGWRERYTVQVLGSKVLYAGRSWEQPWKDKEQDQAVQKWPFPRWIPAVLLALLLAPVFFLGRVFAMHVRWPSLLGFAVLSSLVVLPFVFSTGGSDLPPWAFLLASGILIGMPLTVLYLTVEHFLHRRWPVKWAPWRSLTRLDVSRASGVPWAIARGSLLGSALAGAYALFRYAGLRSGLVPWVPSLQIGSLLSAPLPAAMLLPAYLADALLSALCLAFVLTLLRGVFRHSALVVASGAILWVLSGSHLDLSDQTPRIALEVLMVFLVAAVACAAFVRYDLLTLTVLFFTFSFLLANRAIWQLLRGIGNLEPALLFVLWGGLMALSFLAIARAPLEAAWRRFREAFE